MNETIVKIHSNRNHLLRDPLPKMPATVHYASDSRAAVVTKVCPKSILVARVETGPSRLDMASDVGAWGVRPTLADGDITKIIPGTEIRFTRRLDGTYRNGSCRVTLGRSITRVDWRD
jgi:hypothetical protein